MSVEEVDSRSVPKSERPSGATGAGGRSGNVTERWRSLLVMGRTIMASCESRDALAIRWAIIASVVSGALLALAPLVLARVIDAASHVVGGRSEGHILLMLLSFLGLRVAGQAIADLRWINVNPLLYRIVYRFCVRTCERLAEVNGIASARANGVAEISEKIAVIEKGQSGLMTISYHLFVTIVPAVLEMLVVFGITAWVLTWKAPLILGLGLVVAIATVFAFREVEATRLEKALTADNAVFREIGQVIGHGSLISNFQCTPVFRKRLEERTQNSLQLHSAYFRIKTTRLLIRTMATAIVYLCIIGLLWYLMMVRGTVKPGEIFLVLAYVDRVLIPLGNLTTTITGIQNALVSVDALRRALERKWQPIPGPATVSYRNGAIEIRAVGREHSVVPPFTVLRGERIVVEGASGSSKTTFLTAMVDELRRDHPALRVIYLDDKPILADGTVRDNLLLGAKGEDRARATAYWDEVWSGRLGRIAVPADRAAQSLSGGEAQFLAITRAAYARPDLLVLDEALSAMDSRLEALALELLFQAAPDATIALVSHRSTMPRAADWVIRLEHGCIVYAKRQGRRERGAQPSPSSFSLAKS